MAVIIRPIPNPNKAIKRSKKGKKTMAYVMVKCVPSTGKK
jgi:hypothetical protein